MAEYVFIAMIVFVYAINTDDEFYWPLLSLAGSIALAVMWPLTAAIWVCFFIIEKEWERWTK